MEEQPDSPKGSARGTRPRKHRIDVWVTDDERATIADRAADAGLSLSAFLRAAGLNQPIRTVFDLDAVVALSKVNGDLGRVAGLLKLWLATKRGQGASPAEVESLMTQFRELQQKILETAGRL